MERKRDTGRVPAIGCFEAVEDEFCPKNYLGSAHKYFVDVIYRRNVCELKRDAERVPVIGYFEAKLEDFTRPDHPEPHPTVGVAVPPAGVLDRPLPQSEAIASH